MKRVSLFVCRVLATTAAYVTLASAWPDGAPCIYAVIETMNPLEAVEHQGGLELSAPPFYIHTERKCYWRNQPIELVLVGNSTRDKFKGFAIQPIIYDGPRRGQRLGQFLRLDDNGSWQQQCFRRKDSVTHSHDEPKARIGLWWRSDAADDDIVQFVATVVVSLRKFWVKSILSVPLPPCRLRSEVTDWQQPASISAPPPVSSFKMDTFRMFNKEQSTFLAQSLSTLPDHAGRLPPLPITFPSAQPRSFPQTQAPVQQFQPSKSSPDVLVAFQTFTSITAIAQTTPSPTIMPPTTTARRRLGHVIPIAEMETNQRAKHLLSQQQQQVSQLTAFQRFQQQQQQQIQRQRMQQQQQRQFQQQQIQQQQQQQARQGNAFCRDFDLPQQCAGWLAFCPRSAYMRAFCRRTCQFC